MSTPEERALVADGATIRPAPEALEALVETWRGRLGLENWTITAHCCDGLHEDVDALTLHANGYKIAAVLFQDWLEEGRWETVVVHELCHLVVADYVDAADEAVGALRGPLRAHAAARLGEAEEALVEALARRFLAAHGRERVIDWVRFIAP